MNVDAMVMGAGLGTRLRPLTERLPKPVVPVANRPLAWFAISHLARSGVREIAINTHYLPELLERELNAHCPAGVQLRFVHEPQLLGTGGGIRNVWSGDKPLLVMNGDILFAPDLKALLHRAVHDDAVAAMVVREDPNADHYGSLEIDEAGIVRRLLGSPLREPTDSAECALRTRMFTGVHCLMPRAYHDLPESGCIVRHAYCKWVDSPKVRVASIDATSPWRDLGTHAQYRAANCELARGDVQWPGIDPTPDGSCIAETAMVEGAIVDNSVIGPGAFVRPGVHVTRSVVWQNAVVDKDTCDAVVTP